MLRQFRINSPKSTCNTKFLAIYYEYVVQIRNTLREHMITTRFLTLTDSYSLLLFGARGTGKSTLVRNTYGTDNNLYLDLLDPEEEDRLARHPNLLIALVDAA